jgi:AcrR family transcriptional regulator
MAGKEAAVTVTKRLLVAVAMNEACKEVEIDNLSVDTICERAGISRSTFYRTFADKYEVPRWCQEFALKAGLGEIGRTLCCRDGLRRSGEGLALFRDLIASSIRSSDPNSADVVGCQLHTSYMFETIRDFHHLRVDAELDFQVRYTARASMETTADWILNDGKVADDLPALLDSCYPPRLHEILDHPVAPSQSGSFDLSRLVLSALA